MTSKLVVGAPLDRGLRKDRTAFVIDNDAFPTLINAYQWRGRVKRKRGTESLTRLRRFFNSTSVSYSSTATVALIAGAANILTGFGLQSTGNIIPGTVTITDTTTGEIYTEPTPQNGTLIGSLGGSGTIVYSTGAITIAGGGADLISVVFSYYPGLPVMGLRDDENYSELYPNELAFDTTYSYNIIRAQPYISYDVSFYKNPNNGDYPGYIRKTNSSPVTWNGQNYQQFWTTNYLGAVWATNGIDVPFTGANIGMQFTGVTDVAAPVGNTVVITVTGPNLVVGDFVFANEFDPAIITGINWQTGYVIAGSSPGAITVEFPNSILAGPGGATTLGILQYLTNRSDTTKDCIRWYDGDPTNGSLTNPALTGVKGWVNFMPPLSQSAFSISNLPPKIYYLVGARIIVAFKNRLLFMGAVVQASSGNPIYLQDTVVYSEDGTPFYTASFSYSDPRVPTNTPQQILVPTDQTAFAAAWFEDSIGFGGFIPASLDQPLVTMESNEDALICGFSTNQTRFIFTGNDVNPFDFYLINSELGSSSTFSSINTDRGVITRGARGYIITSQTECRRFDMDVPDNVFEIRLTDNGAERITAQRDFINEWIYFTYPSNQNKSSTHIFPTQTLLYNYRDESWAIFNECYTTYGLFRKQKGYIWQTIGQKYASWRVWNDPWNAGESTLLNPEVIAGNQQGFVLVKSGATTGEAPSLSITSFSGKTVTSPNHCLNNNDFILITGCLGGVSAETNGRIFQVQNVTQNTFQLNTTIDNDEYFGLGLITRYYVPQIQTKQFPLAWQDARKTRIGPQRYLLTKTDRAQITLQIFLSQDSEGPYNIGQIVPNLNVKNSSLVYSTVLYTCPESTNLGLTPSNINLMTPTATSQSQIWHRMNTSLIGDTVQLGFTLSDEQMLAFDSYPPLVTITNITLGNPTVITAENNFKDGMMVLLDDIEGTEELNGNIYYVLSANSSSFSLDIDSSSFTLYDMGGTAVKVAPTNQTAEIELHGFIMDISPSQLLV